MPRAYIAAFLALSVTGCAHQMVVGPASLQPADRSFSLPVPDGWVEVMHDRTAVAITRDGPDLELISAERRPLDQAFKKVRQKLTPQTPPSDLANYWIASMRDQDSAWQVLENRPAQLGGRPAFEVMIQRKTGRGLRIRDVAYGCVSDDGVYLLSFEAPYLHFFDSYRPTFERVVAGFRFHASAR